MPDSIPAANAFYDISNPERRRLHRAYIRKCLDVLGDNRNVVHLVSQEFTGPKEFQIFWLDTVREWERETGRDVHIGLSGTKDVVNAILADPFYEAQIDTIDMRCWWKRPDGTMYAPEGGKEHPGRDTECGFLQAEESTPESIYAKVREYRDRYPGKALIDAINADRKQSLAFLMAGGTMLIRGQICYPGYIDPDSYIQPADMDIILPTYDFIREKLARVLPTMQPADGLVSNHSGMVWCLADPDRRSILAYSLDGQPFDLAIQANAKDAKAVWFNPGDNTQIPAFDGPLPLSGPTAFVPPGKDDWLLWVTLD
jgi:hypothetical protein